MATKDRLLELQQAASTIKYGSKSETNMAKSLKKTFEKSEIILKWTTAVQENTLTCEAILDRSTSNDKDSRKKLEATFKNSETICHNIAASLKELNNELKNYHPTNSAQYRMKLLQYMSLKDRFKNTIIKHQELVQRHRESRIEFLRKCNQIMHQEDLDDQSVNRLLDGDQQIFVDNYLVSVDEAKQMLADLETRHGELLAIENHLTEVKDLFTKLAMLVEIQQESINRVEYHADLATDYIDNTVVDLKSAEKKRKRGSKCKIWITVAVIILVLLIIIGFLI